MSAILSKARKRLSRNGNLFFLYIITFFSALYFYHPIATLYYQERGLSFVEINSLWGIIVGTMALAEAPTGIIADKIGRKKSIVIALLLQLVGETLFIFAEHYMIFALIAVIGGIGFSFSSGCYESMIYDTLKEKGKEGEMQKVSGFNHSLSQLAVVIGALAGGYIARDLNLGSFIYLIIMTAVAVGIAVVVSLFLKEPASAYEHEEQNPLTLLKTGIRLIKSNKSLQRIILLSLLVTPFSDYLMTFYQPYFLESDVSGVWFGIGLALASVLGIVASKYAYLLEKLLGVKKGALIATLLPGIFYLLMAAFSVSWLAIIFFIVALGSMSLQKPIFSDYMNRHIESYNRATVLSIINMFSGIYIAIMGLLIGLLADYDLQYAFVFMGLVIVIGAVFLRLDDKHVTLGKG